MPVICHRLQERLACSSLYCCQLCAGLLSNDSCVFDHCCGDEDSDAVVVDAAVVDVSDADYDIVEEDDDYDVVYTVRYLLSALGFSM